ncbi:hypothetical protein BLOT_003462 [Blomia tropicalis]|nr:hypothetical protein BLOT_003462 [Blomia tropicalis]
MAYDLVILLLISYNLGVLFLNSSETEHETLNRIKPSSAETKHEIGLISPSCDNVSMLIKFALVFVGWVVDQSALATGQ